MSHPVPGHILEQCDFCEDEAIGAIGRIEGGNNAEKRITVKVCNEHAYEIENDPHFDSTYAEELDKLFAESDVVS